eukprot:TRINITY_DN18180_c0_g2_i1.p1 TRINITY_DN18180_c0_g2~~TRINITY_DN18180_c0_g2_i1.p1  ORF type:complete len:1068 (-),score=240.00 TRINITY_DN18180_c0_g2_i1:42-3245(-)
MRAACAAKSTNNGALRGSGVAGALERLVNGGRSSVLEFFLQDGLPLLKPLVDELCAAEPAKRGALLALWLLESAGAFDSAVEKVSAWLDDGSAEPTGACSSEDGTETTAELTVKPPATARKTSDDLSPKKKQQKASQGDRSSLGSDLGVDADSRKPSQNRLELAAVGAGGGGLRKGSKSTDGPQRRVSIWCSQDADSDGSSDGASEEDETSQAVAQKPSDSRSSISRRGGSITAAAMQRRRFTVNITREQLDMPSEDECMTLLRKVPTFAAYDEEDLRLVAAIAKCNKYAHNENLLNPGSATDTLHVIVNGSSSVFVPHKVGSLKQGDFFGSEALQLATSLSETMVCATDGPVTTISINATAFQRLNLKAFKSMRKEKTKDRGLRWSVAQDAERMTLVSSIDTGLCVDSGRPIVRNYEQTLADRELIVSAIRSNKMLTDSLQLSLQQCELICDSVYLVEVGAGETLIHQGTNGSALYILQEGNMEVKIDAGGVTADVYIRPGTCFGELALLSNTPRSSNVVATRACRVWVLHRADFALVTRMVYKDRIEFYTEMISNIPCLRDMINVAHLHMLADALEEVVVLEGENVCEQGDDSGLLFIIYDGECEVEKDGEIIRTMKKGDWIGEQQLLENIPADVTVRVTSESVHALMADPYSLNTIVKALSKFESAKTRQRLNRQSSTIQQDSYKNRMSLVDANPLLDHVEKTNIAQDIVTRRFQKMGSKDVGRTMSGRKSLQAITEAPEEHDVSRMDFVSVLGEGSFGSVVLLRDGSSGTDYALKAVSKEHIQREKLGKSLQSERSVQFMLDSDFVVRLYKTYQDREFLYFLLEPCLGGELFDVYADEALFGKLDYARFYSSCIFLALQHMHDKRCIYRDLKLENCIVDSRGYVKLTDMGIAKVVIGKTYTVCGTADYLAPEVLRQSGHNRAADWWACGVLLFIMATGRSPFDAPEVSQIYKNIIRGFSKVTFPDSITPDLCDVIKSLCRKAPEERITMQKGGVERLKQMPFYEDVDWEAMASRTVEPPLKPKLVENSTREFRSGYKFSKEGMVPWDGSLPDADGQRLAPTSE